MSCCSWEQHHYQKTWDVNTNTNKIEIDVIYSLFHLPSTPTNIIKSVRNGFDQWVRADYNKQWDQWYCCISTPTTRSRLFSFEFKCHVFKSDNYLKVFKDSHGYREIIFLHFVQNIQSWRFKNDLDYFKSVNETPWSLKLECELLNFNYNFCSLCFLCLDKKNSNNAWQQLKKPPLFPRDYHTTQYSPGRFHLRLLSFFGGRETIQWHRRSTIRNEWPYASAGTTAINRQWDHWWNDWKCDKVESICHKLTKGRYDQEAVGQ